MEIRSFTLGHVATNCYLLLDPERREALLFDPGYGPDPVLEALKGYSLQAIIATHCHWDHIYGVGQVKAATGAPFWSSAVEEDWLTDPMLNRSGIRTDILERPCDGPPADRLLAGGERFAFAGQEFQVLHTPGHSPGSLSFLTASTIISGDVLFRDSIGRTDLTGANLEQLLQTIRSQLFRLPDETAVLPGHGPTTTIGRERQRNPYVGEKTNHGRNPLQ